MVKGVRQDKARQSEIRHRWLGATFQLGDKSIRGRDNANSECLADGPLELHTVGRIGKGDSQDPHACDDFPAGAVTVTERVEKRVEVRLQRR